MNWNPSAMSLPVPDLTRQMPEKTLSTDTIPQATACPPRTGRLGRNSLHSSWWRKLSPARRASTQGTCLTVSHKSVSSQGVESLGKQPCQMSSQGQSTKKQKTRDGSRTFTPAAQARSAKGLVACVNTQMGWQKERSCGTYRAPKETTSHSTYLSGLVQAAGHRKVVKTFQAESKPPPPSRASKKHQRVLAARARDIAKKFSCLPRGRPLKKQPSAGDPDTPASSTDARPIRDHVMEEDKDLSDTDSSYSVDSLSYIYAKVPKKLLKPEDLQGKWDLPEPESSESDNSQISEDSLAGKGHQSLPENSGGEYSMKDHGHSRARTSASVWGLPTPLDRSLCTQTYRSFSLDSLTDPENRQGEPFLGSADEVPTETFWHLQKATLSAIDQEATDRPSPINHRMGVGVNVLLPKSNPFYLDPQLQHHCEQLESEMEGSYSQQTNPLQGIQLARESPLLSMDSWFSCDSKVNPSSPSGVIHSLCLSPDIHEIQPHGEKPKHWLSIEEVKPPGTCKLPQSSTEPPCSSDLYATSASDLSKPSVCGSQRLLQPEGDGFFQGREMPDITNQGISEESHNSDMSSMLAPSTTSFTHVRSINKKDWAALHQEYLLELSGSVFEAVGEPRPAFPFLEEDSSSLAEASDKVDTRLTPDPGLSRNVDFSSFPVHLSKIRHLRAEKDHDSLSANLESASDLFSTIESMSYNGVYPADAESLTSGSINTAGNVIPSSMTEAWEVNQANLEGCLQGGRQSAMITSSEQYFFQKRAYHNHDTLATEVDYLPQDGDLLWKNTTVQPGLLNHNSHQHPLLEEKAASQQCTEEVAGTHIDACCTFPSGPELFLHSTPWSSFPSSLQPPPLETFYVTKSRDALTETALEIPACREAWVPSPPPREAWGFGYSHQVPQKAHWKNNLPKLSQSQNSKIDSPQQATRKRPTDMNAGEVTEELGRCFRNRREEENHDSAYCFVAQNRQHLPSTRLKACECGNQLGILNKKYSLSVHEDGEASAWHHCSVAFNGSESKTLLLICDSKASGEEKSPLLPQIQSCGMHSQCPSGARADFIGKITNLDLEKVIPEETAVSLKSRSLHCLSSPVIMAGGGSPTHSWEGRNETVLLREVISKDIREEFSLPGTQYTCERCHLVMCSQERKPTECKACEQSQEIQFKEEPLGEKQNKRVSNTDEMARLIRSVVQLETGILEIESKQNKHLHASHTPSTELMLQDLQDQEKAGHVPKSESSGKHLCFEDQPSFPMQIEDGTFEDSKAREIEGNDAVSNNAQVRKTLGSPFRSGAFVHTRESESKRSYPPLGADRLARDTCNSLEKGIALRKPSNISLHFSRMKELSRALPMQPSVERSEKDDELLKAPAKFQDQTWALESLEELESLESFQESQIVVVPSDSGLEDAKTQGGVEEMTVGRGGNLQEKENMVSSTQKISTPSQHWKGTFFSQETVSPFHNQMGVSAALPYGELSGTQPMHSLSFPRCCLYASDTKGVSSFESMLEPVMLKTNRNSLATGVGDQVHSGETSSSPQESVSGDVSTTHTPWGGSVMPMVMRANGQSVTSDSILLEIEDWITVSPSSQEDQEGNFRDTSTGSTTQEGLGSEAEATVQKERKNSSLDSVSRQTEKRVSPLLQEESDQGEEERQKAEKSEDQQLPNSACLPPVSVSKGPDPEPLLLPGSSIHASMCLATLAEIRQAKAQRKQLKDFVAEGTVLPYKTSQDAECFSEDAGRSKTQKVKLGWDSTRNDAKAQGLCVASPSAVSADLLADERKAQASAGSFHHLPNPETDRVPQHHLLASSHIVSELERRYCTGEPRQFCGTSGWSDSSEVMEKRKETSRTKSSVDPLASDKLLSIPAVEQDERVGSEKVSVLSSQTSCDGPGRILHGQSQLAAWETAEGTSFGGKDSIMGHQEPRSLDSPCGGGSVKISVPIQKGKAVQCECQSVICSVDNAVDLSQPKQDHVQRLDVSPGLEEMKTNSKSCAVQPGAPRKVEAEANIWHPVKWKDVDSGPAEACVGDSTNPRPTPFPDQRPSLHPSGVREEVPGLCPKECLVFEENPGGSRPLGSSYEEEENRTIPCPHLSSSQPTAAVYACCSHSSTLPCYRDGVLRKGTPWAAPYPDHSPFTVPSRVCEVDGAGESFSKDSQVSSAHGLKHKCGPVDHSVPNPPTTAPVSFPAQSCSCLSTSEMRADCLTHTVARGRSVGGSGEEITGKKASTAPEDAYPSGPIGMSSEPLRTLKNNSVGENAQAAQNTPEPPAVTQGPHTLNSNEEPVDRKLVIAAQFGHLENTIRCCSEKMQPSTKVRGHRCLGPQAKFVDMLKHTCHPQIETSWEEEEQQRDQVSGDGKDRAQVRNLVPSNVGGFDGCQTRDGEREEIVVTKSSVSQTFFSDFETQTEPSQPAAQTFSQLCSDREQLPPSHRHLLPVIAIFSGPKHARYSPRPKFTVVSSSQSQELNLSVEPPSPTDEDAQGPNSLWSPQLRGHSSKKPVSTSLKTQGCSQKASCNNGPTDHRPLNPVIPPYPISSTVSRMPTPEFMTTWIPGALEQAHQGKTDKLSVQGMPENWHSRVDKEMLHFGSSDLSPSVLPRCPQRPVHIGWKQYVFGSAIDVSCSQKPQCLIQSNMAPCSSMDNVLEDKKSPFHSHPKTDAKTQDLPNIPNSIENDQSSNELPLTKGSAKAQADEIVLLCPPEPGCSRGKASMNIFEQETQTLGSRLHWSCTDAKTMSDSELASWTSMHNLSVHLSQLLHSTSELLGSLSQPSVVIKEQNVKSKSLDEAQQALMMDGSTRTTMDEGIQTDLALPLAFKGPEVKSEEVSVILEGMDSGITTVAQEKGDIPVMFQKREAEEAAEPPDLHEASTHDKLQSPPGPSSHLRFQKADLGQNFTFMSLPASPDGSPPPSLQPEESGVVVNMPRISHHSGLSLGASKFTQEPGTQKRLGSSSAVLVDRASSPILTFSANIQELSNPLACLTPSVPSAYPLEDFQKLDINPDLAVGDLRPPVDNSQATDEFDVSQRTESLDREGKSPLGKSSERLFLDSSSPCSPQQISSLQVSFVGKVPQELQPKSTTGDQSKPPSPPPKHRSPKLDDSFVSEKVASIGHDPPSQWQGRAANEDRSSVLMVEPQPNLDRPSSQRGFQPLSPCQISDTTGLQSPAVDPPQACQPVGLLCPNSHMHVAPGPQHHNLRDLPAHNKYNWYGVQDGPCRGLHVGDGLGVRCNSSSVGTQRPLQPSDKHSQNPKCLQLEHIPLEAGVQKPPLSVELTEAKLHHGFGETDALLKVLQTGAGEVLAPEEPAVPSSEEFYKR